MGRRVESAVNYIRSVAERTAGFNAYRGAYEYARLSHEVQKGREPLVGMHLGLMQAILPATISWVVENITGRSRLRSVLEVVINYIIRPPLDIAVSWALPAVLSHSPAELIAWKVAGNVVAHVGSDLVDAGARGVNRLLRNFRPSATTLPLL